MFERKKLGEVLPLDTPFSMYVNPVYACNFKCNFCVRSLPNSKLKEMNMIRKPISFEIFKKAVDDLKEFPRKLKLLSFCGTGEPLLHSEIVKMVKYANGGGG